MKTLTLGTTALFNLDGQMDYEVRLFPLSPSKLQEITGAKTLRDSQRFTELEEKENRTADEEKEHARLLTEFLKEAPKLTLKKLSAIIKGKDADDLIGKAKEYGVEELLLQKSIEAMDADEEIKKKSLTA
jgi:hypothetical protein